MAESTKVHPSVEGIFRVLEQVPGDRLVSYEHRLSSRWRDRRTCQLLRAMIQLTLKQEVEARVSLEALREDAVVAQIYRSHWGSMGTNSTNPVPPNQEALVALAVAQIYSLLEEEKFCSPHIRDNAYREAIKAFQASGIQEAKQKSLWTEALEKCGPDFMQAEASHCFGMPASNAGSSPTARSSPELTSNSWDPVDLRSTGSLVSFVSHFEISQSLTVPFVTDLLHQHGVPEAGKLHESASSPSTPAGKGEADHNSLDNCRSESPVEDFTQEYQPLNRRTGDAQGSHVSLSVPAHLKVAQPAEVAQHALQCTKLHNPGGSTPPNQQPSPSSQRGSGASPGCVKRGVGASSSPTQSTSPGGHPASSSVPPPPPTGSSLTDSLRDEKQFFTFMILHAYEDEAVACRVKERLESMGVSNGATFCEDFLLPGHCQLSCFQDALDNSAFTLLLLTENFQGQLCTYQTSVALMDSFTRFLKAHSVVPFIPKENPLKRTEMPILLQGLVSLDENSPVFAKRVKKTFTASAIREKEGLWIRMRQLQEKERQRQYLQALQDLSAVSISLPAPVTFPTPRAGFAGLPVPPGHIPQPLLHPVFTAPGPAQSPPGTDHSQPFMVSVSGGPQPHLIIQNAQMVQIGDYNHMQVERTYATLGTADEDWQIGGAAGNGQGD